VKNTTMEQTGPTAPRDVFYLALIGVLALFIWGTLLYLAVRAY